MSEEDISAMAKKECDRVLKGWTMVNVSCCKPSYTRLTADGNSYDIEFGRNGVPSAWADDGKRFLDEGSLAGCVLACEASLKARGLEWAPLPFGTIWEGKP